MARQPTSISDMVAQDQIRAFIERIERMEEEKSAIADDIKEIYAEAKGNGFDTKVLRQIVRLRKQDAAERAEQEALLEIYLQALGMAVAPRDYDDEDDTPPRRSALSGPVVPSVKTETTQGEIGSHVITPNTSKSSDVSAKSTAADITPNPAAPIPPGTVGGPTEAQPLSEAEEVPPTSSAQIQPGTANESLDDLAVQDGLKMSSDGKPSAGLQTAGVNAGPDQGVTGGESAATSTQPQGDSGTALSRDVSVGGEDVNGVAHNAGGDAGASSPVPGTVVIETTPPLSGMHRHEYLACFPEHWGPAFADIKDDVREHGVREPIQRQGNTILDGWARYTAARELGIEYPVMEYAGDNPLTDIIAWNLESRRPHLVERQAIAKKLIKLAPERADEITDLLDLNQMREAAE